MRKYLPAVMLYALFFLFFIQMAGTLVQSIYVLDLMNTSLDARALGVLFFFSPLLLLPFNKKFPAWAVWSLAGLTILARAVTPSLPTSLRLVASGISVGASLCMLPFLLTAGVQGENRFQKSLMVAAGLALAVGLSTFLRTLNFGVDYSLTSSGAWSGWLLAVGLGASLTRLDWNETPSSKAGSRGVTSAVFGVFMVLTLVYFVFSAPAVLARWTEGNYVLIVALVSLLSLGVAFLFFWRPAFLQQISTRWLVLWNVFFTLSLAGVLLAHRIAFPSAPDSSLVVVGAPSWWQQALLILMLLLSPVIFVDAGLFFGRIRQAAPTPRAFIPGLLLGSLALVLLIFITIFTNVWGYIKPVSLPFRNMFWLPFSLVAAVLCLLSASRWPLEEASSPVPGRQVSLQWLADLVIFFAITFLYAGLSVRVRPGDPAKTSLVVMTYNIQQGNDGFAERSYDRQLALIRQVSPDILALQETDTTRISMNNEDYVRYFAGKLGYYSYYGPTTVTGTFGTAILSRYPLRNTRSVFTYSDTDEIGTAEAQVEVGGKIFFIYDVHPDGSPAAKLAFARSLVEHTQGETDVIALGDFNLREDQEAYQLVAASLTDAWKSLHPTEKGEGKGWIDHIFVSANLGVKDPTYLLPPASASDHPAHWTKITWEK
jgi:endonuclease/exonuclease/phosphatase family metal-dependent hydrolase